jgi:hypothetical protein
VRRTTFITGRNKKFAVLKLPRLYSHVFLAVVGWVECRISEMTKVRHRKCTALFCGNEKTLSRLISAKFWILFNFVFIGPQYV